MLRWLANLFSSVGPQEATDLADIGFPEADLLLLAFEDHVRETMVIVATTQDLEPSTRTLAVRQVHVRAGSDHQHSRFESHAHFGERRRLERPRRRGFKSRLGD